MSADASKRLLIRKAGRGPHVRERCLEIALVGPRAAGLSSPAPLGKWSLHLSPGTGAPSCVVEPVGLGLSGTATVAFDQGAIVDLTEGSSFSVPAIPHVSCVVGKPHASLHFTGAEHHAK
jgi:hypothetical protein